MFVVGIKPGATLKILTILLIANYFSAFAGETLSSLQTGLSAGTIGGYVLTEITFLAVDHGFTGFRLQPHNIARPTPLARFSQCWPNDDSLLFGSEATTQPSGPIDHDWQNPSLDLPPAQPAIGNADYNTGMIDYWGGAITEDPGPEADTILPVIPLQAFPRPPNLQLSSNQLEAQPVPEPTTFAFGSLTLALIALARSNRR